MLKSTLTYGVEMSCGVAPVLRDSPRRKPKCQLDSENCPK